MVRIRFNNLVVDEVTQSSGVFSGKNQQSQWSANVKINQGFGTVVGDKNKTTDHIHTVVHSDRSKDT